MFDCVTYCTLLYAGYTVNWYWPCVVYVLWHCEPSSFNWYCCVFDTQLTFKTCKLDAFPTPLLLDCLDSLLPCITAVFNNSLVSGVFPSVYKSALVKPLLKKMSLDPDDLKNYRPVSNLSFLSNVLERIVLFQLNKHLNHNNLLSPLQSAYRPNHALKLPCSGSLTAF